MSEWTVVERKKRKEKPQPTTTPPLPHNNSRGRGGRGARGGDRGRGGRGQQARGGGRGRGGQQLPQQQRQHVVQRRGPFHKRLVRVGTVVGDHSITLPDNFIVKDIQSSYVLNDNGDVYEITEDNQLKEKFMGHKVKMIAHEILSTFVLRGEGDVWGWSHSNPEPRDLLFFQEDGDKVRLLGHQYEEDGAVMENGDIVYYWDCCSMYSLPTPPGVIITHIEIAQSKILCLTQENKVLGARKKILKEYKPLKNHKVLKLGICDYAAAALIGFPEWSIEQHKKYPRQFHQVVQTLLMIHGKDPANGMKPFHPECNLHRLPIEILMAIIKQIAVPYEYMGYAGWVKGQPLQIPEGNQIIVDATFSTSLHLLTDQGRVYCYEYHVVRSKGTPVPLLEVPSVPPGVKRLYSSFLVY